MHRGRSARSDGAIASAAPRLEDDPVEVGSGKNATLQLAEAVELATAWTQHLGAARGIRLLVIKGATLSRHGLRSERTSADVDVLIDPERFDDFCAAMIAAGWTRRPEPLIGSQVSAHSRTFLRDGWPCDIDVHLFFPGFLADRRHVFEQLWERRVSMDFAHRRVDAADRLASVLILALHSLRDGSVSQVHRSELDQLLAIELSDEERAGLGLLAESTGAAVPLQEVLARIDVNVRISDAEFSSRPARAWRGRVASQSQGAYVWVLKLRETRWRARPALVWRALWPSDADLLISHPATGRRRRDRFAARVRRLGRGFRGLPVALRALRVRGGAEPTDGRRFRAGKSS